MTFWVDLTVFVFVVGLLFGVLILLGELTGLLGVLTGGLEGEDFGGFEGDDFGGFEGLDTGVETFFVVLGLLQVGWGFDTDEVVQVFDQDE